MSIDRISHQLRSLLCAIRIEFALILALFASATSWAAENEIIVTSATTEMTNGTYRVSNDVTIEERIKISGEVTLILDEGKTLDAKKGIDVTGGNSLTIDGGGALNAIGEDYAAGIGGGDIGAGGTITISGGTVTATGGELAAGIGGGDIGAGGAITINGGTVTATGGELAAGIGGGNIGAGGAITINGGMVTATGGEFAAGIGGGEYETGGTITINGGTVTATGGEFAAGIGGGLEGAGGIITINGGTVTATGGDDEGAGIGGGERGAGGRISINGGMVTAIGGKYAAGIGSRWEASQRGSVTLGWTNEDDFIYASSYSVADLKFAEGKEFYYVDENGNSVKATKENIDNRKILPMTDAVKRNLKDATIRGIQPYYLYTGNEINIEYEVVAYSGKKLVKDVDYVASVNGSKLVKDKGEYTLTITAKEGSGYTGSRTFDFSVVDYVPVISSMTEMNGNYGVMYKVVENVSIDERITIKGDATLILGEGTTLEATKGFEVSEGNSLTINGKGSLNATGVSGDAGIGGDRYGSCGSITINGGKVMANGGDNAAGIGPGFTAYTASQNCSVTLGWTNEDDFIYASSYNAFSQRYVEDTYVLGYDESKISFAEGKQFYYVDEDGNSVKATKVNIGNHKILPMTDAVKRNLKDATIRGIQPYYPYTGNEINIEYEAADVSGKKLIKDVDYVASINSNQVKEKGEYTLTITAKEGSAYNGIKTVRFAVVDAVHVTSETTEMTNGFYRVSSDVSVNTRINIIGEVILVLEEGTTLNASMGIELSEGNKLTIEGKGTINATGGNYDSGIGAEKVGTLVINDGVVNATGGYKGAGIGGSNKNSVGGSITINGGTVTAKGSGAASGIGGGDNGNNSMFGVYGRILINGGKVTAIGGELLGVNGESSFRKGIGGCATSNSKVILGWTNEDDFVYVSGNVSNISFADGKRFYYLDENGNPVLATKENIGGRKILPVTDEFNKVNISGIRPYYVYTKNDINVQYKVNDIWGDELVEGTDFIASITPYPVKDVGEYSITISTKSGNNGYTESKVVRFFVVEDYIPVSSLKSTKIFSMDGDYGIPYKVTKNETIDERIVIKGDVKLILDEGSTLNATKGIELSDGNKLTIEGKGTLNATGEYEQAGIGAHSVGTLVINDGNVNATGGKYGAGIGGSSNNTVGGVVTINGGTVSATGGDYAAGIGGGYTFLTGEYGVCGIITINGGKVAGFGHAYQSAEVGNFNVAGIGPGLNGPVSGSVTLSWTNEDDYIYASSYGVENLSFAKDKIFLFVQDEKLIRATTNNIDGKVLRPFESKSLRWATISGIKPYYITAGENVNVTYKVTDLYGNELKEGIDYTESFNPSPVKEKGEYTLTITAKEGSGYSGSKTVPFAVVDEMQVTNETTEMKNGIYRVSNDASINTRINIVGNVILVLDEGVTLDAKSGIELSDGNKLTIEGKGTLNATGDENNAGIGAVAAGTLVINDGIVNAKGGYNGAGLGGSLNNTAGGFITINGGEITATGGSGASGIGGGYKNKNGDFGVCGNIAINGGKVTARTAGFAYGIGPGAKPLTIAWPTTTGVLTLGWTNEDDFIDVDSYGYFEPFSFADGKEFYYLDENGDVKIAEANAVDLNGKKIYPFESKHLKWAKISGIEPYYITTGENVSVTYKVTDFYDNELKEGIDYTESFNPSPVKETGEYTLTITAKEGSGYTGSQSVTFTVLDYIPVTSSTTTMDGSYGVPYKVTKDVSIDDRIHIKGDVKLILGEGTILDARKGIELKEKNALTIEGKGTLNATGDQNNAGIGATVVGSLDIRDGVINARGGSFSAGIGGSYANTYGGEITIYGGVVNATGGYYASGIGGGSYYSTNTNDVRNVGFCGTVNIYGGQVRAHAGDYAFGIGPGYNAPQSGSVTLGWTNKDDFIYVESYGNVESLSFADGKQFYYTDADGKHKMDEANAKVLRGRKIYPYLQYDLKYATISGLEASYTYTGKNIVLAYTVKDFEENALTSADYDVLITKNGAPSEAVNVGEYSIEFSGKGEYAGRIEKTFSIVPEVVGDYAAVQVLRDENGKRAVIDGEYNGTGKIAVGENENVVKVELDRTLSTIGYATITLPFDIDSAKVKGAKQFLKFVGVILNEETKLREVHFERAWCDLPALLEDIDNLKDLSDEEKEKKKAKVSAKCKAAPKKLFAYTPYVVQMKDNFLEFDGGVTLVKTPAAVDTVVGNWKFKGTLAPKVWEEGDPEIGNAYGYIAGTGEFRKVGDKSSIGALRSYLVYEKQPSGTQSSANVPAGASTIRANFSTEFLPANMDVVIVDDDGNGNEHRTVIGKFNTHTGEFKFLMPENRTFDVKGRRVNATRSVGKGRKAKGVYYGKREGRD